MTPAELRALVRTVPDFPAKGIQFRDITTLLNHGRGLADSVAALADNVAAHAPDRIVGMEARGFIFGAAVAVHLSLPFVPIRKPGKLPVEALSVDYALEYGTDRLELDAGAIAKGDRIAIVDDLIATGGTALAAAELLRQAGADAVCAGFVIDLPDLGGAAKLEADGVPVSALMQFDGD
ncbi:adenine phosphoribosyltransferase [Qipengyuania atrilutea]|uniref:Adenine phosphoribosyltransferase n=1 Tax=Qipengyuania atrilutea TaxID=2744473 RepID=A0A850H5M5_9SPHN|nr:adenine phosphoribosyltransferase [Actirhodobacter atriluteus]NVD45153.1 adenine phosphoribosyltransferase [Actirhodobacter atriluteus]